MSINIPEIPRIADSSKSRMIGEEELLQKEARLYAMNPEISRMADSSKSRMIGEEELLQKEACLYATNPV